MFPRIRPAPESGSGLFPASDGQFRDHLDFSMSVWKTRGAGNFDSRCTNLVTGCTGLPARMPACLHARLAGKQRCKCRGMKAVKSFPFLQKLT